MLTRLRHAGLLAIALLLASWNPLAAQDTDAIGSDYLPADAVATAMITVADTLSSPALELYPTEVLEAWFQQNAGIPASEIEQIKIVIGVPGPAGPMGAAVATLRQDLDVQAINPELVDTTATVEVDGHAVYSLAKGQLVMHLKNARTVLIATPNYLDTVLRAGQQPNADGALARMAAQVPHRGAMTLVLAIEPIRPMINGFLQMNSQQIPPPLQPFTKIPDLLDAIFVQLDPADTAQPIKTVMLARDDAAADQLLTIIQDGLQMGKQMFLAQTFQDMQGDDEVTEATRQYMERLADHVVATVTPEKNGRRLSVNTAIGQFASQGVLIGLLLPAVQSAREAARRVSSSNNLRQIGLAVHNYHAAYNKMPGNILATDGTPLLSWRVAILPFIEEQALYEQFKLDEPWDSPNNRPLLDQMPTVYVHPGIPTAANQTVYQRPTGDGYLDPDTEHRFRDIADGLSNTIMAVETPGESAVNWSQPTDIAIDATDPLQSLRNESKMGFHALFADGAVTFITNNVDPQILQSLLTKDGGETAQMAP